MHEAKISNAPTVTIWCTGKPRRELLAVGDLADAFLCLKTTPDHVSQVGTGKDIIIADFAQLVANVVGYRGRFVFATSWPDGPPQKLLDISELSRLGWRARILLPDGIAEAYANFIARRRADHAQSQKDLAAQKVASD